MSKISVCFLCTVLFVHISIVVGELHRAKKLRVAQGQGQGGPLARYPPAAFSDYEDEATFIDPSAKEEPYDSVTGVPGHSTETWVMSMLSASLVGLCGIFPLLVIPLEAGKALRKGAPAARLKLLLSFAVGGLLGDVFLHLLPEAWAHLDKHDHEAHLHLGLWILTGIFSFLVVEKVFPEAEEEEDEEEAENEQDTITSESQHDKSPNTVLTSDIKSSTRYNLRNRAVNGHPEKNGVLKAANGHANGKANGHTANGHATNGHIVNGTRSNGVIKPAEKKTDEDSASRIKTSGWLNLMANIIDNFTHGLAVAGSYCISTKTGVITTIAVLLHEVPHEVGDFAILLRSGFDRWKAAKAQLLTATGGLFGALVALMSESAEQAGDRTAWVLPFTSGGFIYIALVTVVPDLLKENNWRHSVLQVVLILVGIVMVAGVTLLCE